MLCSDGAYQISYQSAECTEEGRHFLSQMMAQRVPCIGEDTSVEADNTTDAKTKVNYCKLT